MPDLDMSVTLSRDALGLADLEINDHVTYAVAPQFLGGTTSWTRQQITSPFVDAQVTTQRFRAAVVEQIAVEIYAGSSAQMQAAMAELITAFNQDSFTLTVTIDDTVTYAYLCEAADVQVAWTGPRMMAHRGQLVFSVPRQPIPVSGAV